MSSSIEQVSHGFHRKVKAAFVEWLKTELLVDVATKQAAAPEATSFLARSARYRFNATTPQSNPARSWRAGSRGWMWRGAGIARNLRRGSGGAL